MIRSSRQIWFFQSRICTEFSQRHFIVGNRRPAVSVIIIMVPAQKAHTDVKMDLWLVSACLSQTGWNTAAEHTALIIQQPDQACRTRVNWWVTFTSVWVCMLNILIFISHTDQPIPMLQLRSHSSKILLSSKSWASMEAIPNKKHKLCVHVFLIVPTQIYRILLVFYSRHYIRVA